MLGQVKADQVAADSSKNRWLLIGFAFGCWSLGVASACLVFPGASRDAAHHVSTFDMMFNPLVVAPLRQKPATDVQIKTPSSFLPRGSRTHQAAGALSVGLDGGPTAQTNAKQKGNARESPGNWFLNLKYREDEQKNQAAVEAITMMMFTIIDTDGNGELSEKEFKAYLDQYGYTESDSTRIFKALDANSNGAISLDEIRGAYGQLAPWELANFVDGKSKTALPASKLFTDAQLGDFVRAEADKMFDVIDENGDGEVSATELRNYLMGVGYNEIASDAVLRSIDSNEDGKLSRSELCEAFVKYSALRQSVVEHIRSLVNSKRWSAEQ